MGSHLNPYISFAGDARQAMEFYQTVLGGNLTVNTFGDMGAQDSPDASKVMHSQLETDNGFVLMASDTPEGMEHNPGTNISISLSGDAADDLRRYWDKLAAAGTVALPLEKQAWGDEFGIVTDQFGIGWMVNITQAS